MLYIQYLNIIQYVSVILGRYITCENIYEDRIVFLRSNYNSFTEHFDVKRNDLISPGQYKKAKYTQYPF